MGALAGVAWSALRWLLGSEVGRLLLVGLVAAGAMWGGIEVVKWRAGNEAVREAEQETGDAMGELNGAARDGRDAYWRCLRDGGMYDHGSGRCKE